MLVALTADKQTGRLAEQIRLDFEIFAIPYRLNDFYFVDIRVMLLIVLEVRFSLYFSNNAYLGCVLCCVKFSHHFFLLILTIRY